MLAVYRKELLELRRDKKTLFFIIALPMIVFPVMFAVMALVIANVAIDEQHKVLKYHIINGGLAPEFSQAMFYHRDFKQVILAELNTHEASLKNADIKAVIASNQVDVVIKIPTNFTEAKAEQQFQQWQLFYNGASQINSVKNKMNKVFKPYITLLREKHLQQLSITDHQYQLLTLPIKLKHINTADKRENFGEKVGGFIPYILIILCLTGAMYPAIDLAAGEKERGTLETLLLTPISRTSLVMGKFFTIVTTAMLTALITLSSLVFWAYVIGEISGIAAITELVATIGMGTIMLIIVMLLPLSAVFAALVLCISIYARSYKEAQNYMAPITALTFMPVMIAMLPGIKLDSVWAFVPVTNIALAIKEILKGTFEFHLVFYIFISTATVALLALCFCVYWFKQEKVLFR